LKKNEPTGRWDWGINTIEEFKGQEKLQNGANTPSGQGMQDSCNYKKLLGGSGPLVLMLEKGGFS